MINLHRAPLLVLTLTLAAAGAAQAQKLSAGLWETTTEAKSSDPKMQAQMAQAQAQMANLPPEQRKMVEQMMAKQGVGMGAAGKPSIRVCMSKEQADRAEPPADPEGRCSYQNQGRSGNTLRLAFTCTNPPSKGTGEMTLISDKAYSSKMMVEQMEQGKPQKMEFVGNAKWVSADCGALKPIAPAR